MNQNLEKWRHYTSGLSSPDNYIDWSWRYLISAFLQRRVWLGPDNQQCFANMYSILVGQPGIGKGLVIREVSSFLRHWKLKDAIKVNGYQDPKQQATAEMVAEDDLKKANELEMQPSNKQAGVIEPLLVPVAADATTYEALVEAVANSYRRINYIKTIDGKEQLKVYGHSSICFALQELASLMRKRTDDTVNYLLGLYDCPTDYEYVTKTKGKDRVRRGCLNLIAGTTPSFMQSIFNDNLIDEGFSSRAFFIYAEKNRKNQFFIPPLSSEQEKIRIELLEHLRKLTCLYGSIRIDAETEQFLTDWWDQFNKDFSKRPNTSAKLIPYYARKNIHVMKVAITEWFSDNVDMHIPLPYFKRAIEVLEPEEKRMHLAIQIESNNPLARLSKRIIEYLSGGEKNMVDILTDMWDHGNKQQIEEALAFLLQTGKITINNKTDEVTDREITYYRLI